MERFALVADTSPIRIRRDPGPSAEAAGRGSKCGLGHRTHGAKPRAL